MCERADKKQFKNENRSISSGAGYLQILETTVTLNLKIKILHMHEYLISDKKKTNKKKKSKKISEKWKKKQQL